MNKQAITFFLVLAAVVVACHAIKEDIFASRRRQNYVDPIYAYDEIDTHTVSVANNNPPARIVAAAPSTSKPTTTGKPAVQLLRSSFIGAKKNGASEQQRPAQQKRSSFEDLAPVSSPNQASERPRFEPLAAILPTARATSSNQYSSSDDLSLVRVSPKPEEKHHWSGLENYYRMIQQQQRQSQQQQHSPSLDEPIIYQIGQEPSLRDEPIGYLQQQQPYGSRSGPIILVPASGSQSSSSSYNRGSGQTSFSFPLYDQSYNSQSTSSQQYASKGAPPLVIASPPPVSATSGQYPSDLSRILQQSNVYDSTPTNLSALSRDDLVKLYLEERAKKQQAEADQQQQRRYPVAADVPPLVVSDSRSPLIIDGRVIHQEPARLQEIRDIQRQQQRFRHQQETLGSLYDSQRGREQIQEDIYCRARNLVNFHLPSAANQTHLTQLRIEPSGILSQDVTVQLSAGEFPSHMGVYNGTPGQDNFLCAATWIEDGYALTTASCVDSLNPKILQLRFGEWNLNKPNGSSSSSANNQRQMFTSPVREIILFPRYNKNNSYEHNLALLKLDQPINFLQVPYASPACQRESRYPMLLANQQQQQLQQQRARSCWAPVRNITLSEYFDAEGEGETREKKNVAMIEMPVILIADDDAECLKRSRVELYNFNHPNYICSADYRLAPWRAKLNQSDYFGSGIYCNEAGSLSLISLLHPIGKNTSSAVGYLDISYYRPWMRRVISERTY